MTNALLEKENIITPDDDVSHYLHEIRRYPLLKAQEELELAKRCASGDEDAIRIMVNSNLRLVVSVAKEYAGRGVPLLDLIQEGSIGLLSAAKKFDYTMDCRFSTYATKWIRQGVSRCVLNHAGVVRVPLHTMEKMRKLLAVRNALRQELGEEPTMADIAERSSISVEKAAELLALVPDVASLDAPAGEDATLQVLLENLQSPQPYEELVRSELRSTMDKLLSMLDDRQQLVLKLHFGIEDGVCHSLDEIGKMLGVSKERARQIERQAMDNLQKLGAGIGLEDFLE